VNVARARLLNLTAEERTIGTVVPVAAVAVTAQVSGQLMSASFQEGQIVHRGDVLFRIDPRAFSAALQQAQAALARDKANAANAERDKARYLALLAVGATSKQQRDQAVATADADNAIVKSDEAAVAVAQLNLGYATIRSPITGKTGPILVQPGNLITANAATSPLVSITQIQPIKVSVSLPQADLPDIARQQREKKLSAVLRWQDGKTTTAPVTFVSNQVDARTGTIELRATFPNTDGRLVPGQLVETGITMNQYRNAVVVPRDAVNAGPAGRYVYVVTKSATAELREVTETYDDGTNAAIAGDVKAGDLVILQGQLRVQPGQQVSIANSGSISTAAGRQ
jgi:multidrug efflux system membrane fusion protein